MSPATRKRVAALEAQTAGAASALAYQIIVRADDEAEEAALSRQFGTGIRPRNVLVFSQSDWEL